MATFTRPSWGDPGREKYTLGQLRDAQNLYDLTVAQEESNKIQEKAILSERKNAELLADAQIRAEQNKYKHDIELLEKQAKLNEYDRQQKLYDDYKVDYNDMMEFLKILVHADERIKIQQEMDQLMKNIDKVTYQINHQVNGYEASIKYMEDQINYYNRNIISRFLNKNKIKALQEDLNHLKESKTLYEEEAKKRSPEKLLDKYNQELQELETKIKYSERNDRIDEFNTFRKNHYNVNMETFLTKINIGLDKININEIEAEGTEEDYRKYIQQIINS